MTDKDIPLVDTIWILDTWKVIGAAALFGFVGGIVRGATATDPDAQKKGALGRAIVLGVVAAIAVLYVARPADGVALLASSVVAGYAGQAIMDALAARAKLDVAKQETAAAKQETAAAKDQTAAAKDQASVAKQETVVAKQETAKTRGDLDTALTALGHATASTSGVMGGDAVELARRQADARDVYDRLWRAYHGGAPPT